jgi:hypothetical protein
MISNNVADLKHFSAKEYLVKTLNISFPDSNFPVNNPCGS